MSGCNSLVQLEFSTSIVVIMITILSEEMNALLSKDFMEWEVEVALKQMTPLKVLGPDGMPPPPPLPLFLSKLLEFDRT